MKGQVDRVKKPGDLVEKELSEEQCQQLEILENTQRLLVPIIASLLLQYKAAEIDKQMLLDKVYCPETFDANNYITPNWIRVIGSLMVLYSLSGFQRQSEFIAEQKAEACQPNGYLEPSLNRIVIAIAVIRFLQLAETLNTPINQAPAEEIAQEEELETPIEI